MLENLGADGLKVPPGKFNVRAAAEMSSTARDHDGNFNGNAANDLRHFLKKVGGAGGMVVISGFAVRVACCQVATSSLIKWEVGTVLSLVCRCVVVEEETLHITNKARF